jgi:hypothetical protein
LTVNSSIAVQHWENPEWGKPVCDILAHFNDHKNVIKSVPKVRA